MGTSWDAVLNSGLHTFCVGRDQKKFTIHSGVVRGLSSYFNSVAYNNSGGEPLSDNDLAWATPIRVSWEDIEPETFLIFSQFAYTRDYDVPDAGSDPRTSGDQALRDEDREFAREKFAAFSVPKRSVRHWANEVTNVKSRDRLTRHEYIISPLLTHLVKTDYPSPGPVFSMEYGSASTLLMHVKAYVLADRYSINSLKEMTLHKLHHTLMTMYLNFYAVDCVSEAVRYTYENTTAHEEDTNGDSLRGLLTSFCACVYDGFLINPSFRAVLRDHSEFAEGILDKLKLILE